MEHRFTDEQLEAALNDQLDPALADHPVASFFREGTAAFDAFEPVAPSPAMVAFFKMKADAEKSAADDVPVISSASMINPVQAESVTPFEMDSDRAGSQSAIQPADEDVPAWTPVIVPAYEEDAEFSENQYELSNHSTNEPDADVRWLDAERSPNDEVEPETSTIPVSRLSGRRAATIAALIAAIVGGAQATGTMDLLPRRVVDMAAGYEDGSLNLGRKPTDPEPKEIRESDGDRTEPNGEDMPEDLFVEDVIPNESQPNLRPANPKNFDQIDNEDGFV